MVMERQMKLEEICYHSYQSTNWQCVTLGSKSDPSTKRRGNTLEPNSGTASTLQ